MKIRTKFFAVILASSICLLTKGNLVFAENNIQHITPKTIIAKTSMNTSVYGDDLDQNMIDEKPIINRFEIESDSVNISGFIDTDDKDTAFCLTGTAYKTYDNNIVCDVIDLNEKYDVIFVCLEKKQGYNDYILYRDSQIDISGLLGEYGLKIYLMKKGTRDISILEDTNVEISNVEMILSGLNETEYSKLNWFTNCFIPSENKSDDNQIEPFSVHKTEYTYWGDQYYIGNNNVSIQMGIKLKATNDTPSLDSGTFFTSKLEFEFVIKTSDPAYNNPARAEDKYRVSNVKIQSSIGKGYYLQSVWWNGVGYGSIGAGATLSLSVGISYGPLGANLSISPNLRDFQKDNWLYLVNSECDGCLKMPRQVETIYKNITLARSSHYLDFGAYAVNNKNISEKFKAYSVCWTFDVQERGLFGSYSTVESNELYCSSWF